MWRSSAEHHWCGRHCGGGSWWDVLEQLAPASLFMFLQGIGTRCPFPWSLGLVLYTCCPIRSKPISSAAPTVEARLRERFNKTMHGGTGLFRDWETYKASLPVRMHRGPRGGEWLKLHELPYWGATDDVKLMAKELERDDGDCALAHYVCSPSKTGKTTSILPAFLESDYFTHYLYLAFRNNAEWTASGNLLRTRWSPKNKALGLRSSASGSSSSSLTRKGHTKCRVTTTHRRSRIRAAP